MDDIEVEQEVTDFLLLARSFSEYPSAAAAYCRQSLELIVHHLHYKEYGKYPEPDPKGNYPSA